MLPVKRLHAIFSTTAILKEKAKQNSFSVRIPVEDWGSLAEALGLMEQVMMSLKFPKQNGASNLW